MLERTELSDTDREQPRKVKRDGNYGVYGNSDERIRNGKDAQDGKGKSKLKQRKHKHGKDYQVIGHLSKKGEMQNKMKETDRRW